MTTPTNKPKLFDRVNHPETADIAQTTVALAICMTCALHAGFAETQQQTLKAYALILLALPAAGYILLRPKPRVYRFGSTLQDFKPNDLLGSGQPDLPAIEVGRPRREAIKAAGGDAVRNETTLPATDLAVMSDSFNGTFDIPLGAVSNNALPVDRLDVARNVVSRLVPIVRRVAGTVFGNASTTAGVTVGVLVVVVAVFA